MKNKLVHSIIVFKVIKNACCTIHPPWKNIKKFEFRHLITPVSLIQGLRQKPGEAEMLLLNFYYNE